MKVGTSAHSLWYIILIGIVFISSGGVRAHAPPRPFYYGHRVEQREPFKHIPSSLVFGVDSPSTRDRLYDVMPTCSQLKTLWKNSLKVFDQNNNQNPINNNNINLDSNEIPVILNNPYYMPFLYGLHQSRPHFGKIISKPATHSPIFEERPPVHHTTKGLTENSAVREEDEIAAAPGQFMNEPSKVNVVYGHVIHSPEEADDRRHTKTPESKHRYHERGRFGEFVAQADDSNESNGRSTDTSNYSNDRLSSGVKQQRTAGNGFSTAEDFFKSGVWHDQPVIPSVSFQRIH